MIHAVAEGLALSLDEGVWRARVRGWICRPTLRWLVLQATVCVCVKSVWLALFGCFFSAPCWRTSVSPLRSVDAVRGPSHTSVRPNISSHGTTWLCERCEQDTTQRPARKASCSECKATSSSGSAGAQPRTAATHSASAAGGIHT